MAIDPEFDEMMNDICTFRAGTAVDAYGKRSFGSGISIRGRLIYEDAELRTEEGRVFYSHGKFLTYGTPSTAIDLTYRMTLPDSSEAIVLGVDNLSDEDGEHHTVVRFGK